MGVLPPESAAAAQTRVGVLGEAGVGKSTLINALLSERLPLLPQGGIGPLTAIPIEVRYARSPYLEVECRGAERVRELMDACASTTEQQYSRTGGPERALRQMAALVASGSQFGQVPDAELSAFLRSCLNDDVMTHAAPILRRRVERVRRVIALGDAGRFLHIQAGLDLPGFLNAVEDHGAGFLAPLTARIRMGWDCPVLANELSLTDLPGLGIANDIHRLQALAEDVPFRAILLVVDRAGLTEASAAALSRSLSTHPYHELQPRGPFSSPALIVAVTKLDQPAESSWCSKGRQSWTEICSALAIRARALVRAQLRRELESWPGLDASLPLRLRLSYERAEILPVFPREYQRLHRAEPDEPARLDTADSTGIPGLVERLQHIARRSAALPLT